MNSPCRQGNHVDSYSAGGGGTRRRGKATSQDVEEGSGYLFANHFSHLQSQQKQLQQPPIRSSCHLHAEEGRGNDGGGGANPSNLLFVSTMNSCKAHDSRKMYFFPPIQCWLRINSLFPRPETCPTFPELLSHITFPPNGQKSPH